MAIIGIITSRKNEEILKKSLNCSMKEAHINANIIAINDTNINNMKHVKFHTIVMQEENSVVINKQKILKEMLVQTKYLILNSDKYSNLELINQLKLTVITYGLNLKSTVTASSIEKDKVCLCIQRSIENEKGQIIEPNEISIKSNNNDIYKLMISYILTVLYN